MAFDSTCPEASTQNKVKKRKTVRRHGACNPCKASKTRCDGKEPCGACRHEKRRTKICEYSDKVKGLATARQQQGVLKGSTSVIIRKGVETSSLTDHLSASPSMSNDTRSQLPAQISRSSRYVYTGVSLQHVVDEFICVQSVRGRSSGQLRRLQDLWSSLEDLMENDTIGTSLVVLETPLYDMQCCSKIVAARKPHESDAKTPPYEIENSMQACLDVTMELVSKGKLMQAWNSIAAIMRKIESFDIKHGPIPQDTELFNDMTSTCLKLIDLDCILSFFVGGDSHLSSWSSGRFLSTKIEQYKRNDQHFSSKIDIFETIQSALQIDVSQDEGVWRFLHMAKNIKSADPVTQLEKVALVVNGEQPAEKQELKLIANLVLTILHCRKAIICAHYAESPSCPTDEDALKVVDNLKLSGECSQAIKHAGAVLDAFESLCKLDAVDTARCWFRLHGALIAATVVGIDGLRDQRVNNDKQKQLEKAETCFQALAGQNSSCPIFDIAIPILKECTASRGCLSKTTQGKSRGGSTLKRRRCDLAEDQHDAEYHGSSEQESKPKDTWRAPSSQQDREELEDRPSGNRKKRKFVRDTKVTSRITKITSPPKCQDDVNLDCRDGSDNAQGLSRLVQPTTPCYPVTEELHTASSFNSITSTITTDYLTDSYVVEGMECPSLIPNKVQHPPMNIWNPYLATYGDEHSWYVFEPYGYQANVSDTRINAELSNERSHMQSQPQNLSRIDSVAPGLDKHLPVSTSISLMKNARAFNAERKEFGFCQAENRSFPGSCDHSQLPKRDDFVARTWAGVPHQWNEHQDMCGMVRRNELRRFSTPSASAPSYFDGQTCYPWSQTQASTHANACDTRLEHMASPIHSSGWNGHCTAFSSPATFHTN